MDSALLIGVTRSTRTYKSVKISHADSSKGTLCPIKKGKHLSRLQISWAFPTTVFFHPNVSRLVLSVYLKIKRCITSFKVANVKYFFVMHTLRTLQTHEGIFFQRDCEQYQEENQWSHRNRKGALTKHFF